MALTAVLQKSRGGEQGGFKLEHMFDKVVTPSDVGKLNRLVVPKLFAERYFLPRLLGGGATARLPGAVLRFEDGRGGGRSWAFRFSYWSSSQSYVMTKGWSAFVRDRRLAAGDTVTFCRSGVRLFIDCRRRGTGEVSTPATSVVSATSSRALMSCSEVIGGAAQPVRAAVRRGPRTRRRRPAAGFAASLDEMICFRAPVE